MKLNLHRRIAITIVITSLLVVKTLTLDTQADPKEIRKKYEINPELIDKFYSKKETDDAITDMKDSINTVWIITGTAGIISMQLGFSFLEVGTINPKNRTNILIKNLLDTYIGALAFYAIGFAVSNNAGGGLMGSGDFFCRNLSRADILKWLF